MRLERDIVIGLPVGDVFSYVSEPANLPSWQPAVLEVRRPEGGIAVGGRFGETRNFVGKRFQTTVEIVELERDKVFAIRVVDGPLPLTIRHVFEPEGDGTRLTIVGEAELRGPMRMAGGVMAKAAERDAGANLARLKALLENGGQAS